jgi:ELWxxDGT repeat protein
MVEFRGQVYFDAYDGVHGVELWRTDGTAVGTALALDLVPGEESSSPTGPILNVADRLFFAAGAGGDRSLFRSDGTPAATAPVPGTEGIYPLALVPGQDRIYFRVPIEDGSYSGASSALWTSDGTEAGTLEIREHRFTESQDCGGLNSSPANSITVVGSLGYFCSYDAGHGAELWRTDGTVAGTSMVADLAPGPTSSKPIGFTPFGDEVAFFTLSGGSAQVWRSDGTAEGTHLVTEVPADQTASSGLVVAGARLFFMTVTSSSSVLWSSDGTPAGTRAVEDLPFFTQGNDLTPGRGAKILFSAYQERTGAELWRSDGTAGGTRLVKDIAPGRPHGRYGRSSSPEQLTAGDGEAFFTANVPGRGRELWRTDGTRGGTKLVGEVRSGPHGGRIADITPIGDRVFFAATTPRHGEELWIAR